jgi:hypothetical protein
VRSQTEPLVTTLPVRPPTDVGGAERKEPPARKKLSSAEGFPVKIGEAVQVEIVKLEPADGKIYVRLTNRGTEELKN